MLVEGCLVTQENVELFLSSVYKQLQQMENKNASVVQTIDNQVRIRTRCFLSSVLLGYGPNTREALDFWSNDVRFSGGHINTVRMS